MRKEIVGLLLATTLLVTGCSNQATGTLEITEDGTYDVSSYSEVVVNVSMEEETESLPEATDDDQPQIPEDLKLTRVQFRDFSMEVPEAMAEGFTAAELTENNTVTLSDSRFDGSTTAATLYINRMESLGHSLVLEDFTDAPQEQIGDLTMAVRHTHNPGSRNIEAKFVQDNCLYTISLYFSFDLDDLYSEYSDTFYKTVQF